MSLTERLDAVKPHAYCMKCKAKKIILHPFEEYNARGTRTVTGRCSSCGTNVSTFLKQVK